MIAQIHDHPRSELVRWATVYGVEPFARGIQYTVGLRIAKANGLHCIRVYGRILRDRIRYTEAQLYLYTFLSLRCPKSLHFSVFVHSLWPRDRTIYPGLSVSLSGPPSDHETDVSCCVVSCFRCVALAVLIVPQSAAAESHHAILHLSSLCRIWTYMLRIR